VVPVLIAAATVAAVSAATAGDPACRDAGVCDCEAVGAGPIRQPFNAWSSLALTASGAWIATRSRRDSKADAALGLALAAAGLAAFAYHATLSGWGAGLDEAAVTLLTVVLAAHRWQHRLAFPAGAAIGALFASCGLVAGLGGLTAIVLGVAALIGHVAQGRFGDLRLAAATGACLASGAVAWWAAARPSCEPALRAHAGWHVAAAVAGLLGFAYLMSCERAHPLYPDARNTHHGRP
jgi:dihydroceramidase